MTDARATFAIRSEAYAEARPRYPAELYSWILDETTGREAAWDCACGNGQAARDLAPHFQRVYASDISPEQLNHAILAPNIEYRTASAESSGYPDAAFDLITVAQALHWFDFGEFWPEVRRVARDGSFFCAWGYAWFSTPPDADLHLVQPIRRLIAPYWAPNNRLLWNGYRPDEVGFPFKPVRAPTMSIDLAWRPQELLAYMQTWSAYKRASADAELRSLLERVADTALSLLPSETRIPVSMPIAIIAGRVTRK
ncbi:UNVERIFIED_ORG: hypothetical protein BTE55_09850 [Rhizobium sophorae]